MKIYAITLNYGSNEITKKFVKQFWQTNSEVERLIIVNNNTESISVKDFANSKKVHVIENGENLGFSKAVNKGIRYALAKKAEYILLINNDTKPTKGLVRSLSDFLQKNDTAGIVGPAIKIHKKGKTLFDIGGKINKLVGRTSHTEVEQIVNKEPRIVDYVSGCCMLIRSSLSSKVGLLNEDYFLYYDDPDLCFRAKKKGFITYSLPSVFIEHAISETIGLTSKKAFYNQTRSGILFGNVLFGKNGFKLFMNRIFLFLQCVLFFSKNPKNGIVAFKAFFQQIQIIPFIFLLTMLSFLSHWQVLKLGFWLDDWPIFWGVQHDFLGLQDDFHHPGTPLEFFFLSHLFGANFFLWQVFGLLLRITLAYVVSIVVKKITKSSLAGFLSGIFVASSIGGIETLYFASTHVVAMATIALFIAIYFFVDALKGSMKRIRWFVLFLLIGLVLDTPRIAVFFIIFPLLFLILKKTKNYPHIRPPFIKIYIVGIILSLPLFFFTIFYIGPGTQFGQGIQALRQDPFFVIKKAHLFGNFAATIANIFFGWIVSLPQNVHNEAYYSKLYGRIGAVILLLTIGNVGYFLKTKKRMIGIIAFFLSLIWIFLLPNWLSEPRAPMGLAHHYVLISAVGFLCLLGYVLSKLPNKTVIIIISFVFVILNIYQSNRLLGYIASYRSNVIIQKIWNAVDREVPQNEIYDIFVFTGEEPTLSESVRLTGGFPLAIKRNMTNIAEVPLILNDPNTILQFLCGATVIKPPGYPKVIHRPQILLSHVYSWEVKRNGDLINTSQNERDYLNVLAKTQKSTVCLLQ